MQYFPFALSSAIFLAAPGPELFWREIMARRESCAAYCVSTSRELSVEASSIQMTSIFVKVWPSTLSRHGARNSEELCTGMITETFGGVVKN